MLIDEKGRLCGRVNIVDFAIVLAVILAAAGLLFFGFQNRVSGFALYELKVSNPAQINGSPLYDTKGRALGEAVRADEEKITVRAGISISGGNIKTDGVVLKAGRVLEATAGEYFIKAKIENLRLEEAPR